MEKTGNGPMAKSAGWASEVEMQRFAPQHRPRANDDVSRATGCPTPMPGATRLNAAYFVTIMLRLDPPIVPSLASRVEG